MSSFLTTTAFLGLAIIGSVSDIALAEDTATKIKPCLGELCPPKSSREDMPAQTEGAAQVEQMKGQDGSSAQVMPRKKKQASLPRNRHEQSSGQVTPLKKKEANL